MMIRKIRCSLLLTIFGLASSWAQQTAPQTARQALLEMFFSQQAGTFVKHLPQVTRTTLEQSGALSNLEGYSMLVSQMHSQNQNFQTFETGPVLLSGEDPKTGQKVEIRVLSDKMRGDRDDIGLSFLMYKEGQPERTPYMPEIVFTMKQEAEIWKLNEVTLTIHLPLADPDLLKAFMENMKKQAAAKVTMTQGSGTPVPPAGSDDNIVSAMKTILAAETTYAATYSAVGYTCTLSDLDGFGGNGPNEHQAMLINSGLASGRRYGYVFTLSGCGVSPAARFRLTAVPNSNMLGRKAFCADQSGVIRTSSDANPAMCETTGVALK